MTFKKKSCNRSNLERLLRKEQLSILLDWVEYNDINPDTVEYEDDLLNGIRVWGQSRNAPDEFWEIDFIKELK